jgi:hypothetical protein
MGRDEGAKRLGAQKGFAYGFGLVKQIFVERENVAETRFDEKIST